MHKNKNSLSISLLTIFTGSVFLTSGKLVENTNTPKFYFVVISLLIATVIITISHKHLILANIKRKIVLWGISIIFSLQACFGLLQFVGWFPSNHSRFTITGSFDNPAGFAAVLAMGFPICLYLLSKAKKIERCFVIIGLVVITMAIFLSGSRTGILAITISPFAFFLSQISIIGKFQKLRYYKLLTAMGLIFILAGSFALYYQKKDSANGRLLIWKVSSEMIKDKPVFGHGYGVFQANYMDYQAEYFKNNPNSPYVPLADNIKHPFNEFVKIAVEFGIVGLAIILSFVLFGLWKILKSENENRALVLSGLSSFLVLACFSYPLQYVAIWLMLAFYLSLLLPSEEIKIKHTPISIISRIVIVIACTFSLFHFTKQIQAEIKWKTIAKNSLRGNTKEMLPEYEKLYTTILKRNCYFLYNYGAELNVANQFERSIKILNECKGQFNDYDLQMLLADNYHQKGEIEKAIRIYQYASNMVPCRFLPLYHIFEIYKKGNQRELAIKYANEIINKEVKIKSNTVSFIKSQASNYLNTSQYKSNE